MKLGLTLTLLFSLAIAVPFGLTVACTPAQLQSVERTAQAIDIKAIPATQLVCDLVEPIAQGASPLARGFVDFACLVLEEGEAWLAQLDAGAPTPAPVASVRALVVHVPSAQAEAFYQAHYPGAAVLRALVGDAGTFTTPAPAPALFPPAPPPPPPPLLAPTPKGDASP
jgi:hypothetical protein